MKTIQDEKKGNRIRAFRAAFPYTIPVLTGYLFIGMAFGVMIQEKGYNFLWAMLMSLLIYAGSGQYLAVNFFAPGVSLLHVIFMEFMLNIRHIFYGLSLLERFSKMGKKRLYMIFSLTDETYSLFFVTKVPPDVREDQFLFAIALLDQSYWIIGSGIGALLGNVLPFSTEGIDFAMTALFVVIMTEQWMERQNRRSVVIGLLCGLLCLIIFGADNFILPTMICIMAILLAGKRVLMAQPDAQCVGGNVKPENDARKIAGSENGEPENVGFVSSGSKNSESGNIGFVGSGAENGNEREVNQNAG